jgi:hypothetical protein
MDNPEIDEDGSKFWWVGLQLHRIDGPAIEWADDGKEWWVSGIRHRTDGPACEWPDGRVTQRWYLNGEKYKFDEWLDVNSDLTHEQKVMMKLTHG